MAFKKLIITVLGLATVLMPQVHAQFKRSMSYNYWRIGIGAGSSNYLGDLDDDFSPKFTRPGAAITAAYRVSPLLSMRGSLYYGQITATDAKSLDPIRNRRNLNFTSNLVEASLVGVVDFRMSQRRAKFRPNFTPYVFAGVALYSQLTRTITVGGVTKPINIKSAEISAESYLTEQQLDSLNRKGRKVTDGVPISIPMGVGLRFKVTQSIDIEVETGFRRTFTDYLDGVSQEYNLVNAAYGSEADFYDPPKNPGTFKDIELQTFTAAQMEAALLDRYGVVVPKYFWSEDDGKWVVPITGTKEETINFNEYKERGSRGDGKQLDWYTFTSVTVSFYLDSPRRCPSFR